MTALGQLIQPSKPQGFLSVSDQRVIVQCHHYTTSLDQTLFDALGGESLALRRQAAFQAAHTLLANFTAANNTTTPTENLNLAADLFRSLGHGHLALDIHADGGSVHGHGLHHGMSFVDKHGARPQHRTPRDCFAAGYIAAAASLAFPSRWGYLDAEETTCVARGDATCTFILARRSEHPRNHQPSSHQLIDSTLHSNTQSRDTLHVYRAGATLIASLEADPKGRIFAYGTSIALLPVHYIHQVTLDTMHLIETRSPQLLPSFEALLREAAQVGAFHLLTGILASPAFATSAGPIAKDPHRRLQQLLGLSRALGWGTLSSVEFLPGRSLVLNTPVLHQSASATSRHSHSLKTTLAFFQGTALAIMQILHRVNFDAIPPIVTDTYSTLFKGGLQFFVEHPPSIPRDNEPYPVLIKAAKGRAE